MSTPGNSSENHDHKSLINAKAFSSPPSAFALGLVALAVIVGLVLVGIVNSDSTKTKSTTTQDTTVSLDKDTTETKTTVIAPKTTTPVAGIKKPDEVTVLVLNGSSIAGVAGAVTNEVQKDGYKVLTAGDDASKDKNTEIYYKSGFEKDAKQLATNVLPGILDTLKISQTITTKQFPANATIAWDQQNLVSANILIVIGDA